MGYMGDRQLKLALSIISGRTSPNSDKLSNEELRILGYNPYSFSYYGSPSKEDILLKCEDIVYSRISCNSQERRSDYNGK